MKRYLSAAGRAATFLPRWALKKRDFRRARNAYSARMKGSGLGALCRKPKKKRFLQGQEAVLGESSYCEYRDKPSFDGSGIVHQFLFVLGGIERNSLLPAELSVRFVLGQDGNLTLEPSCNVIYSRRVGTEMQERVQRAFPQLINEFLENLGLKGTAVTVNEIEFASSVHGI